MDALVILHYDKRIFKNEIERKKIDVIVQRYPQIWQLQHKCDRLIISPSFDTIHPFV